MWYPFPCQVSCNDQRINIHILLNAKKMRRNVGVGLYLLPSLLSFVMPTLAVVEAYVVAISFTKIADKADMEFQCVKRRIEIEVKLCKA